MYPDERIASFIRENFVPIRIHIKENKPGFERFGAQWTPTVIVADSAGAERHRFEGFLPVEEYLPQLEFGLAKVAFARGDFSQAERRYREVAERYPKADIAPEALYWAGVSRYKRTDDASALEATAQAFRKQYTNTVWAKKASVWAA